MKVSHSISCRRCKERDKLVTITIQVIRIICELKLLLAGNQHTHIHTHTRIVSVDTANSRLMKTDRARVKALQQTLLDCCSLGYFYAYGLLHCQTHSVITSLAFQFLIFFCKLSQSPFTVIILHFNAYPPE